MTNETILGWPKELAGMALVEVEIGRAVYLQRARYGGGFLTITDTRIHSNTKPDGGNVHDPGLYFAIRATRATCDHHRITTIRDLLTGR